MEILDKAQSRKHRKSLLGLHEELLEQFLIHISSDTDSEDGDGGNGGINDSSTSSSSGSKSSSAPTSSDVRLLDICSIGVTT